MTRQGAIPAEDVAAELADVLGRAEFHETPSLFEQLLDWLVPDGSGAVQDLEGAVVALLLVVFVGASLFALRSFVRGRRASYDAGGEAGAAALDPAARLRELRAAAARARAGGDARLALRLLFEALLVALGGRGDLEFRPAWTNRELVRRGRHVPAARVLLERLVRELEPKEFGHAAVEEADLARLEALLAPHLAGPGGAR